MKKVLRGDLQEHVARCRSTTQGLGDWGAAFRCSTLSAGSSGKAGADSWPADEGSPTGACKKHRGFPTKAGLKGFLPLFKGLFRCSCPFSKGVLI